MDKQRLRQAMTARRHQLTRVEVNEKSQQICMRLQEAVDFSQLRVVHCYQSSGIRREVDTSMLIAMLERDYPSLAVLVPEDHPDAKLPDEICDIIIVPIVAFDDAGNRVGLGAGWYDRLVSSQPAAATVGLAYDFQQVPHVPVEAHDASIDMIVTPTKIVKRLIGRQLLR